MPPASVDRASTAVLDVNGGTVEVAGVCAEGDNCIRYHCRACGDYWLLDPAHACRAGRPSRRDLEQTISNWVDEQLKRGDDLATSAAKVLQRVKQAGLGEVVLDVFGDRLITELWREHQEDYARRERNAGGMVNGVHKPGAKPHGQRRVDVDQLSSETALLETLLQVDGEWVRLGDLDRDCCRALERKYTAEADVAWARAQAFGRLAAELEEGQTVRERWTAAQLEAVIGNTLHGAAPALPVQI